MKQRVIALVALVLAAASLPGFLLQESAKDIVRKMDEKMQGKSSRAEMVMKIVRPTWSREIGIKSWSKGTAMSLTLITAPARDQGTAFLKRNREIWNWQPGIDRTIKLPPSMMMQSWMGSDFTNDDLVRESSIVNDYTHTLKGDTTIGDRQAYKIELIPKESAAVVWGKIHVYVDKKDYLQLLVRYFDEDGEPASTMHLSNIKMMGGRLFPTRMEMTPADNPGNKTIIEYRSIEFDVALDDSFFSVQNMKNIR